MLVDGDLALGKRASELRRLELEGEIIPAQGVVGGHGPLLFDRKDEVQIPAAVGSKGRAFLGRGFEEKFSVLGQKGFKDVAIRVRDRFDAVKFKFFGKPVLPGAVESFAAAAGLGRISRDGFNAELMKSPPDLSEVRQIDLASRFWGVKEVSRPVRIKGAKDSLRNDHMIKGQHAFTGRLFGDQFGVIDVIIRVIRDED